MKTATLWENTAFLYWLRLMGLIILFVLSMATDKVAPLLFFIGVLLITGLRELSEKKAEP